MSGPKRGTWRIVYDPTPQRLADLSGFAGKLDVWLERHGRFLEAELGTDALAQAHAARDQVYEQLDVGDPDQGFDDYGVAWAVFNELHDRAHKARREREHRQRLEQEQQQRAEQERQQRLEQDRRQRLELERRQRLDQERAASALVDDCFAAWRGRRTSGS